MNILIHTKSEGLPKIVASLEKVKIKMALILVVDDSQDDLMFMTEFLKQAGHECRLASSGEEAIEQMNVEKFDLIISDLQMRNGDGNWLLNELGNIPHAPPCIIVTADRNLSERHFKVLGAKGFCFKPLIWHQLKLQVDRLLA